MSDYTTIESVSQLKKGDHICRPSLIGFHHFIVVEVIDNKWVKVIHMSGDFGLKSKTTANIRLETVYLSFWVRRGWLWRFDYREGEWETWCCFFQVYIEGECFQACKVVERARSRLGEDGYDLYTKNCEHFARWSKTGKWESRQIENLSRILGGIDRKTLAAAAAAHGAHTSQYYVKA
jgi:hypothetical protein